ncbi:MAG: ABC transporter permease subunit [Candidatus Cloacimonetes bacterium]|jgi:multiple sugar transport system permease protein|nr:ABC transporter permease subunit [Candidatus Cloacimonadota bacterium]
MAIIGTVGRKRFKYRFLDFLIHFVLIVGSITMVYPFLLMLSSSVKSGVDSHKMDVIPAYIYNEKALYQKYIESRYNEESSRLMDNYPGSWISFREVELPDGHFPQIAEDFEEFLAESDEEYGVYHYYLAEHYGRGVYPLAQREYRKQIRRETGGDLLEFNRRYNTGARFWEEIMVEEKDVLRRNFASSDQGYLGRFRKFKEDSPLWMRYYINPEGAFVNTELIPVYSDKLQELNADWSTDYQAWDDIRLPRSYPGDDSPMAEYWLHYVRDVINIHHLKLESTSLDGFRTMLSEKYDTIRMLNQAWDSSFESFAEVELPAEFSGAIVEDIGLYLQAYARPDEIGITNIAEDFRDFLEGKYGEIAGLSASWGRDYGGFEEINYPTAELDYHYFKLRQKQIRGEFLKRNYLMALDQMLSDARSLRNTGIYIVLSILLAITINPLAAYALSRFKPKFSYQLIMLFMLTMAFPGMVMGIPNFLMLKKLNLLNTFWALVLPAAADGYFIFLLKGFFDSLPRELYESAKLDGASEFRLFWQFTLYLSKPILAVIALNAFNAAYRNFLFAFLVCQDQSMWTLMVHIYELMQRASSSVGYAALVIAAIPTLLVFIFFQNIIIKGIVIPMEK